MALAFGNKVISKAYFGGKTVSAIYLGTKKVFPDEEGELPGSGDIRLRIQTTTSNGIFRLFYRITIEEGGYVSVDWGDGDKETFTGKTTYKPTHTYATAGEYTVKLTGSKFVEVGGGFGGTYFTTAVREILSLKMPTDSTSVSLYEAFRACNNLTGSIPAWDDCIVDAAHTYYGCDGLTGRIPKWGANIRDASWTYYNCSGLTSCSVELLQDPMPSRITEHDYCVTGCVDEIRQHFTPDWGGIKEEEELPGTGDIRLRIKTTSANQSFPLFYRITTKSGGYVSVDWGDGNSETLTGRTTYQPTHAYAAAGEYVVKLTGSKFTGVGGGYGGAGSLFQTAVREVLSLKMPTDSTSVSLDQAFYECRNLTGSIPEWDDCITRADNTYTRCSGLTGRIPEWGANIVSAIDTYRLCTGLTGRIPAWGMNITKAYGTYDGCSGLTGSIPEWGANITDATATYRLCTGLTGSIPEWGANITDASYTYYGCTGLTGCSEELLQDPMPSRITHHDSCVTDCVNAIRQHFTPDWGGIKEEEAPEYLPGTGDIRLRIRTASANQSFPLFYRITTEEGGYVSVDWGDGNTETFTGSTTYQPEHTYATAGEYIVKLTGSKFTGVEGADSIIYNDFQDAVREILSLKMPTDSTSVSLKNTFYNCDNLTGNIPEWDNCITSAYQTYWGCDGLTGRIPKWGANIRDASWTYYSCSGLWGSIPAWGANITNARSTYNFCSGLTGRIPAWGASITDATATYSGCTGLTSRIPAWGANITNARGTYNFCSGLTGEIPAWGTKITNADGTYDSCTGLTGCSEELLQDPMPSWITDHNGCVSGCVDEIRKYFTPDWGGTKEELPGTGDIRLRIETTKANQSFRLFYTIWTERDGFVSVDWGDGNVETFSDSTGYSPKHVYHRAGEYVVKLTGSKFTSVSGPNNASYEDFQNAVREILSLKMPTDSTNVSLDNTFKGCKNLTGSIPAWDDCIVDASQTYWYCSSLTGNIPEWGPNIVDAEGTYTGCVGLTGNIPEWGPKITDAYNTYRGCTGLTGNIPEWGSNITNTRYTYSGCTGLTGSIPAWGANIIFASYTYQRCAGLTGNIPAWGANITGVIETYYNCTGLTGCSEELLQDPMPSWIKYRERCVEGCVDAIRQHFKQSWGGTRAG